jgi:hypothetical protein
MVKGPHLLRCMETITRQVSSKGGRGQFLVSIFQFPVSSFQFPVSSFEVKYIQKHDSQREWQ